MWRYSVVYVIQKSNKYGLKQEAACRIAGSDVVYVIQKSNKYGLKQDNFQRTPTRICCVCHSKK